MTKEAIMILQGNKLVKVYGGKKTIATQAVKQVDLKVEEGDFLGIMGPSGSGKTTLLNLLSGIDQPTTGEVIIRDTDITKLTQNELAGFRRKRIGFVFQDFNLMDSLTVKENIILPLVLDQQDPKEMDAKALKVMKQVGINNLADKYPVTLSGGEQQRVAICRGMITHPDLLFSDEPTGNLDTKSSKNIMESFANLNNTENMTMVMVTHDPFAASYCKRVIFLVDGRVRLELNRGDMGQKAFLDKIVNSQTLLLAGEQR